MGDSESSGHCDEHRVPKGTKFEALGTPCSSKPSSLAGPSKLSSSILTMLSQLLSSQGQNWAILEAVSRAIQEMPAALAALSSLKEK